MGAVLAGSFGHIFLANSIGTCKTSAKYTVLMVDANYAGSLDPNGV
jgi:hypothetical protein